MRDRLIELLKEAHESWLRYVDECAFNQTALSFSFEQMFADHLLAEGIIVPPCKVGDKAYHLTGIETRKELDLTDVFEGKVCSISKQEEAIWIFCRYNNGLTYWYKESDIGRKLFLAREDAERALERSENGT